MAVLEQSASMVTPAAAAVCREPSVGSLALSRETDGKKQQKVEEGDVARRAFWFLPCSPELPSSSKLSFLFLCVIHPSHSSYVAAAAAAEDVPIMFFKNKHL